MTLSRNYDPILIFAIRTLLWEFSFLSKELNPITAHKGMRLYSLIKVQDVNIIYYYIVSSPI